MIRPSLIDKCKSMMDQLSSSYILVFLLLILIIFAVYLYKSMNQNVKKAKKVYLIGYSIFMGIILLIFHKPIWNAVDAFITKIFALLCFPNMILYLGLLILINIIFFKNAFKEGASKYLRVLHILVYFFLHFNTILLVSSIMKNGLDVASDISLYANQDFLNIMSISIGTSVVWILFLLVQKIIYKVTAGVEDEPVHAYRYVNGMVEIPSTVHIETDDMCYVEEKEPIQKQQEEGLVATSIFPKESLDENMTLSEYKKLREMLLDMHQTDVKEKAY